MAETGAAGPRSPPPVALASCQSRCVAGGSTGLGLGGKVRITDERMVSSIRAIAGCSACQQASSFSA